MDINFYIVCFILIMINLFRCQTGNVIMFLRRYYLYEYKQASDVKNVINGFLSSLEL